MTGTPFAFGLMDHEGRWVSIEGTVAVAPGDPAAPGPDLAALADFVRSLDPAAISNIVAQRSSMGTSTAGLYLDTIAQQIEASR